MALTNKVMLEELASSRSLLSKWIRSLEETTKPDKGDKPESGLEEKKTALKLHEMRSEIQLVALKLQGLLASHDWEGEER